MRVWPEKFLRVIDGPAGIMIASRDAQMRPAAARGSLVRLGSAPDQVVVYVMPLQAEHVLPNLRDNGAIALTLSLTTSHEGFQLKGRVREIVEAPPSDEPLLRERLEMFLEAGARLGVPRDLIERVSYWPALRITFDVEQLFQQTPGPGAGDRVRS